MLKLCELKSLTEFRGNPRYFMLLKWLKIFPQRWVVKAPIRSDPRKAVTTVEQKVRKFQVCNFQYQSALRESLKFVQPEASLREPLSSVMPWQQTEQRDGRGITHSYVDNVMSFKELQSEQRSCFQVGNSSSLLFKSSFSFFGHHGYPFFLLP